jgi:two-component sensor histidine kinase/streptogramin lyase
MRYDLNLNAAIPVIRFMHNDLIANSLPVRVARSVLEDNAGNIWVGTVGGGLCCYAPGRNKFQVFQKHICDPAPLAGNKVEALSFDAGGRLWAGTDKGLSLLENRNDGIFRSFYHTPTPGKSANYDWIYDMVADSASGDLYLAYWGNLPDRFNTQTMQFEPLRISNLSSADLDRWGTPYMFSVAGDHRGNLFFSTWSGGGIAQKYNLTSGEMNLFDWDTDEYARQSGLLSFESTKAYPTRDGKLWLGNSEGKGLIQVDFSKLTVHHQVIGRLQLSYQPLSGGITNFLPNAADSTALQDGSVGDMLEDRKGRLWIGTDAGLHWMANREKGVFRHFGKAQGLPDTKINAIVEDDRGYLWLGTQNGLCCFDPDAARVIAVYGTEDGLPDKVFMAQAGAKSPTGELAFGTAKGFCLFHPDSLFQNTQAPGIQLCNLEVNGAKRPIMPDGIELGYNEKNLVFDFAAMDFSNPRKNQYQYYLEGFDDKWSAPTPIHHVVYNNLSSGNYVLHIRGSNNDGFWSKSSLRFPVTIYTPWWNAWWFRTILLLMFLGFVWAFVWIRETRMRKKQEDNEKEIKYQQAQTLQAQINHHFIFNVLGAIQNQILNNDKKEANRQLVNLSKLIRRFLDSSSQSDNPLDQEIELLDMYIQFEQSQRPGKFTYKIEVDESINPQNTTIPPLMIQPYVENAIKHGLLYKEDSGHLEIRFFKQGEALVCTVDDDGVGRKKAGEIQQKSHKIYKSHGTRLVQERIARLNGLGYHIEIQTQDQPDGGTLVTIKFSE